MTVLVTGAAGMLGRYVVQALAARDVRVRGTGRGGSPFGTEVEWNRADLLSGKGVAEAMAGAGAVVHCASNPHRPEDDVRMLETLVELVRAGGGHLVFVGIAGIEDAAGVLPYYRVKLACEEWLAGSGVPHTICRATQFHPFVDHVLARLGRGPIQFCPPMRLQPVDPRSVADRLADLSMSAAQGRVPDLRGPETLTTTKLIAPWLQAHGRRRLCLPIPSLGVLAAWDRLLQAEGEAVGVDWRTWLNADSLGEG